MMRRCRRRRYCQQRLCNFVMLSESSNLAVFLLLLLLLFLLLLLHHHHLLFRRSLKKISLMRRGRVGSSRWRRRNRRRRRKCVSECVSVRFPWKSTLGAADRRARARSLQKAKEREREWLKEFMKPPIPYVKKSVKFPILPRVTPPRGARAQRMTASTMGVWGYAQQRGEPTHPHSFVVCQ